MNQPLLMGVYPRAPDGSAEIERERMSQADVRFAASKLKNEAVEAFAKADALNRWWRAKRRAERAATG